MSISDGMKWRKKSKEIPERKKMLPGSARLRRRDGDEGEWAFALGLTGRSSLPESSF